MFHATFGVRSSGLDRRKHGLAGTGERRVAQSAESGGFVVFITCDQSLRYQQNLVDRRIAIIELTKNNWPSIQPSVDQIVHTVNISAEGEYHTIECAYLFRPRKR